MATNNLKTLGGLILGGAIVIATPAFAQDRELENLEEEVAGTMMKRGEVTNLWQRESVQDAAATVRIFAEEALEDGLLDTPTKIFAAVPNASYSRGAGAVGINGVGALSSSPGSPSHIGVFEDGHYSVSPAYTLNLGSFTTEQYEVFTGPQDVARSHGTLGGAVNRVSKTPGEELSYEARFVGGHFGRADLMASLDGSLTDLLRFRMVAAQESQGGVVRNLTVAPDDLRVVATNEGLGTVGKKFQELQLQLGSGEVSRFWTRIYHANQGNSPFPLLNLYPASARGSTQYVNPATLETNSDIPRSIATFIFSDEGDGDAVADTAGTPSPRDSSSGIADFITTADPKTLNGIDDPWATYRNYRGEESLSSAHNATVHWDLNLGSYAVFSTHVAERDVGYSRAEDGDGYGDLTEIATGRESLALDVRAEREEDRHGLSREIRLGTRGKRTLSWNFGQYVYREDAKQTVRARDASGNLGSDGYSNLQLDPVGQLVGLDVGMQGNPKGLLSEYYLELENRSEDTFFSGALDFGGFAIFAAMRSTAQTIRGGDRNLFVYGGGGGTNTSGIRTANSGRELAFRQYAEALGRVVVDPTGDNFFGTAATPLTIANFNNLVNIDFDRSGQNAADASLATTRGHFMQAALAMDCLLNDMGCGSLAGISVLPDAIRTATTATELTAAGVEEAFSDDALVLLTDMRYLHELAQAAGTTGVSSVYSNAASFTAPVSVHTKSSKAIAVDADETDEMSGGVGCTPSQRESNLSRCFERNYSGDSSRAGVQISLGEGHALYFATVTGYKAGGFLDGANDRALLGEDTYNPLFKSETVTGTEIGLKLGWKSFVFNVTNFNYTYEDMQSTHEYLLDTGLLRQAPVNIPEATVSGTDLALLWKPANWLAIDLSYGILATEVTALNYATDATNVPTFLHGEFQVNPLANLLPYAPENETRLGVRLNFSQNVTFAFAQRTRCEAYTSVFNTDYGYLPEQTIIDLRLTMRSADKRTVVTIYGENASMPGSSEEVSWDYSVPRYTTETTYVDADGNYTIGNAPVTTVTSRSTSVFLNNPRMYGVQFDYKF